MRKIDWDILWAEFEKWHRETGSHCSKCFSFTREAEWPDQMQHIEKLVEAQMRAKK